MVLARSERGEKFHHHGVLFRRWEKTYKDILEKTNLCFEEDDSNFPRLQGSLEAIHRIATKHEAADKHEPFFVFLGDNYFDDDLVEFFTQSRKLIADGVADCVTAVHALADYREAKRFGIVTPTANPEKGPCQVRLFTEKPNAPLPQHEWVAAGCYAFSAGCLQRIDRFLKQEEKGGRLGPGHFLADLAPTSSDRLWCLALNGGWFDIGYPSDLQRALVHHVSRQIDTIRKVEQLLERGHTESDDKVFVACRTRQIKVDARQKRLVISLSASDLLLSKSQVDQIAKERAYRTEVESLKCAVGKDKDESPTCGDGQVLLSGGALFIDTNKDCREGIEADAGVVLQRRDLGAGADPDRLTMPAGRLDNLSLTECCYTELREEIIAYGNAMNERRRVWTPCRTEDAKTAKLAVLERITQKRIQIPGIDPREIERARRDGPEAVREVVESVPVTEYPLEKCRFLPGVWHVFLKVDGKKKDDGWFFVAVDTEVNTVEFRKVICAPLSHTGERERGYIGHLAGIADGEGHGRMPLLVRADSLASYAEGGECMLRSLRTSGDDQFHVIASGEPNTGRFTRFDFKTPPMATTTTLAAMCSLLSHIVRRASS